MAGHIWAIENLVMMLLPFTDETLPLDFPIFLGAGLK